MSQFAKMCCFEEEEDTTTIVTGENIILKQTPDEDHDVLSSLGLPGLINPLPGLLDSCVKGLGKNQDIVRTGKKGEEYFWIVCCDGHGDNSFVDILKSIDWCEIMESPHSYINMQLKLERYKYNVRSGSTLCMVKIFVDKIECLSIGDSRILIYKNSELEYTNTPHNYANVNECDRLRSYSTRVKYEMFPGIRTDTIMRQKKLSYVTFLSSNVMLSMTQSIGHLNITGFRPEIQTVYFNPDLDNIRVIVGTDGFFDMCLVTELANTTATTFDKQLTLEESEAKEKDVQDLLHMNAEELASKAEARWKQEWAYYYGGAKYPELVQDTKFDNSGIDDVGIAVWHNL
jgi:serine/threonine protein phosphatase PrpC